LVVLSILSARLHVVIERGHKDEYRLYGPQMEACVIVVNQEQAFEAVFQMKDNCG
jgi:hypothetical protein